LSAVITMNVADIPGYTNYTMEDTCQVLLELI
jgi:hypothetical protein